jgi:hypothetical protein
METDPFGVVVSDPTAWRVLSDVDGAALGAAFESAVAVELLHAAGHEYRRRLRAAAGTPVATAW